jgi:arsenical pump membrane protein
VLTAFVVVLLVIAIAGALAPPARLPFGAVSLVAAVIAVVTGAVTVHTARGALDALAQPLAFLLLAVPLAALLDRLGVFDAAARTVSGPRVAIGCWVLGAVGVAVLNLDAAVVLLTPLYIRLARRLALDPVAFAFQPALLACLASCVLPASNLTNLIAVQQRDVSARDFVSAMGPASIAAFGAGYAAWRIVFRNAALAPATDAAREPFERAPIYIGAAVIAMLLIGFLFGDTIGLAPWAVVAIVDAVLVLCTRYVPWRAAPVGAAVVAGSLAVLAAGVAARVDVGRLLAPGTSSAALARDTGVSAVLANAFNNLPAFLVLMPFVKTGPIDRMWAVLLGVNIGPLLLVTGTLSGLLWLTVARREGLRVGARDYFRVGVLAGMPAFVLATITFLLTR